MGNVISKLNKLGTLIFWIGVPLLAILVGMATVGISKHYADARKLHEPEISIRPKNCFPKTIHVIGDTDYRPFSYLGDDMSPRGYDIELVTELANRLGYNLELTLMNWNDAVQMIQEKKADLILGCDWQDTAVMDCNFTIPTFEEKFVVFQEEPLRSFSELYRKKIAVIEGCGIKDTLRKYQLWSNCSEYDNVTDCVHAVLTRQCDCFLAHRTIGEICLRDFGDKGKKFKGRLDFASGQMCFGISKNADDLFARVNATLIGFRADGTMDALERKWLEHFVDYGSFIDYLQTHPLTLFVTINLVTIVILVIIIMYYYLNRIRKEKNRAVEAEQAKNLFFSTVSHDIRTPLNAIIGFSELLKLGIDNETERQNALEAITTSSNTLLELINDVLNLSKLETNKMVFNLELTDMTSLASKILHSFDIAVNHEKLKLVEDFEPLPLLMLDPLRIRQILFNLIGNAVKFTEHGEIRLKIRFEKTDGAEEGTGKLTFSVSDTGYGIAPENQKRLMQPFIQVQGPSAQKGTGLGLYICRQLALHMGGDLTLDSMFGKGSTFTVTMPNVKFSTVRPNVEEEKEERPKPLANKRILVVDDMSVNRLVIQALLKRLNITNVTLVANGIEALKALNDSQDGFDAILTDIWMPVMDGKTLVREIRKNEQWKTLPVYAVTADTEAKDSFMPLGFTGLLLKPITMDKLRQLLS